MSVGVEEDDLGGGGGGAGLWSSCTLAAELELMAAMLIGITSSGVYRQVEGNSIGAEVTFSHSTYDGGTWMGGARG